MSSLTNDTEDGSMHATSLKFAAEKSSASTSAAMDEDQEITTDEYHANGAAPSSPSTSPVVAPLSSSVVTPHGLHIDRTSLVRLLQQSLHSLGYPAAASALSHESGIELEARDVKRWRQEILNGDWQSARSRLGRMKGVQFEERKRREAHRVLAEQQYLVLIEQAISGRSTSAHLEAAANGHANGVSNGKVNGVSKSVASTHGGQTAGSALMKAVQFLQSDLVPLYIPQSKSSTPVSALPHPHILHLSSLLTCTSAASLQATYKGPGILPATVSSSEVSSSSDLYLPLYQRLSSLIPSDTTLPRDHQLLHLLEHSIRDQITACHFHRREEGMKFKLDREHRCEL